VTLNRLTRYLSSAHPDRRRPYDYRERRSWPWRTAGVMERSMNALVESAGDFFDYAGVAGGAF
jgi:hypothetical protein